MAEPEWAVHALNEALKVRTRERDAALAALRGLLERYRSLMSSADCADWNPETHDEVIAARRALGDACSS